MSIVDYRIIMIEFRTHTHTHTHAYQLLWWRCEGACLFYIYCTVRDDESVHSLSSAFGRRHELLYARKEGIIKTTTTTTATTTMNALGGADNRNKLSRRVCVCVCAVECQGRNRNPIHKKRKCDVMLLAHRSCSVSWLRLDNNDRSINRSMGESNNKGHEKEAACRPVVYNVAC